MPGRNLADGQWHRLGLRKRAGATDLVLDDRVHSMEDKEREGPKHQPSKGEEDKASATQR